MLTDCALFIEKCIVLIFDDTKRDNQFGDIINDGLVKQFGWVLQKEKNEHSGQSSKIYT